MPRLPQVTADQTIRALRRDGWYIDRHGRHLVMRQPTKLGIVVIPTHPGTLPPGTLRSILQQAGLTIGEFSELL